ncbi:hypothetical protein Pla22_45130 [Rubripirellula amarantea]|uniref:Uncharacterized protein n=1 Tax=Rubripirellula amarantea TaxID=2527999 RepID=A0A5C5WGT1_9BACT|nr:hypothetical protein Pla22_45130 [Rubripirellula amarantea]
MSDSVWVKECTIAESTDIHRDDCASADGLFRRLLERNRIGEESLLFRNVSCMRKGVYPGNNLLTAWRNDGPRRKTHELTTHCRR